MQHCYTKEGGKWRLTHHIWAEHYLKRPLRDGERVEVPMTCRLDTAEEVSIYEAGGVLQRFAQDFLAANRPLAHV